MIMIKFALNVIVVEIILSSGQTISNQNNKGRKMTGRKKHTVRRHLVEKNAVETTLPKFNQNIPKLNQILP
jgi:hypothetical protein